MGRCRWDLGPLFAKGPGTWAEGPGIAARRAPKVEVTCWNEPEGTPVNDTLTPDVILDEELVHPFWD